MNIITKFLLSTALIFSATIMANPELDDAFSLAVRGCQLEKIQELINAGADVNTPIPHTLWSDAAGDRTIESLPLIFAIQKHQTEVVKILLQVKNKLHTTLNQALEEAAIQDCPSIVEELIKEGADVNYINENKDTPLTLAANYGWLENIKIFLREGANVNHANKYKNTPLIFAARRSGSEVTQIFLKAGANINHVNNYGRTALMEAIECGYSKVIQLLLKMGAKVNFVDNDGRTALMEAVKQYDLDTVQSLLKNPEITTGSFFGLGKKPINYADKDGNTALIIAIKKIRYTYIAGHSNEYDECVNSQGIVEALLNTPGINLFHVNKEGETAITLLDSFKKNIQNYPRW